MSSKSKHNPPPMCAFKLDLRFLYTRAAKSKVSSDRSVY